MSILFHGWIQKAQQSLKHGWGSRKSAVDSSMRIFRIKGKQGAFEVSRHHAVGGRTREDGWGASGKNTHGAILGTAPGKKGGDQRRELYRKLGLSTKSLAKSDGKQLSNEEVSSKIRNAFDVKFRGQQSPGDAAMAGTAAPPSVSTSNWHIERTYPTYLIVSEGYDTPSKYLKISYKINGDAITFGKPQKMKMVFQVTKAGEVAGHTFKKAIRKKPDGGMKQSNRVDRAVTKKLAAAKSRVKKPSQSMSHEGTLARRIFGPDYREK